MAVALRTALMASIIRRRLAARMACVTAAAALMSADAVELPASQGTPGELPSLLSPWVPIGAPDQRSLDDGEVIARTLPGDGGQLSVFAATRLAAEPEALVAWIRAIAALKRSRSVPIVQRFSDPPVLSDLDALSLQPGELDDLRRCQPGQCGLKLSASEIGSLRDASARAGEGWREALEVEFRKLVLARLNLYRTQGMAAVPPIADRRHFHALADAFAGLIRRSPYLWRIPGVTAWLQTYPHAPGQGIESFFYWSKEDYGRGKPVISVTHVGIVRPEPGRGFPAVLVTGKQIFATHYLDAALGVTMVLRDPKTGTCYLVYINRSDVDVLRGFFGTLARGFVERRVKREAPQLVRGLRARVESGNPPSHGDGR